jgi:glycosyltransferase involved in cell wall biosynthesis
LAIGALLLGLGDRLRIVRDRARDLLRRIAPPRHGHADVTQAACRFKRGDLLLNLGSSWINAGYARGIERAKVRHGIRYAALICDLIPWVHPRWFNYSTRIRFLPWARETLRTSDLILAISRNTKGDIERFAASEGLARPDIEVIRLGERPPPASGAWEPDPAFRAATRESGFVLSVGTIEIRKNHQLLFEVWQELLQRHGRVIPVLVWAGRGGWFTEDLMNQVEASNRLDGKLIILGGAPETGVDEAAIRFLYRNCLFTMFPSWYEGWGLPVAESIAFGKYCIASNAASIPEVAGDLVDYHAPEDFAGCYELAERAVLDPDYRAGREARIRAEHRPYGWADCAKSICEKIVEWQSRRDGL